MARIFISGGGTGGHIYPAIGIAKALTSLDREMEIVFVGGEGRLEATVVPQHGFSFEAIPVAGFPRKLTLRWFPVIAQVGRGFLRSLALIRRRKPDIVLGTGGYVCGPVLLAAVLSRVPIVIQEQNAVPGLTNRWLSRWAEQIYSGFEAAVQHFPVKKTQVTGNPIRSAIGRIERSQATYAQYGLDPALKTVFIMGGSQGAHAINALVMEALRELEPLDHRLQILHQTGAPDYKAVRARYDTVSIRHHVAPYFDPIEPVYSIADLMVCRAGGMTIAEITACGIPALFLPLPTAAGDHQRLNAEAIAAQGAGIVLDGTTVTPPVLATHIIDIVTDAKRHQDMATASAKLGKPDASCHIAASILSLIEGAHG